MKIQYQTITLQKGQIVYFDYVPGTDTLLYSQEGNLLESINTIRIFVDGAMIIDSDLFFLKEYWNKYRTDLLITDKILQLPNFEFKHVIRVEMSCEKNGYLRIQRNHI